MKSILIVIVIFSGFTFFSPVVFGQSKFALSASISPFYSHTRGSGTVTIPDASGTGMITSEWKTNLEAPGYWIGLSGRYSFSSRWSASAGLWLSHSWQNQPRITTNPSVQVFTGSSRSHNFLIPVMINFRSSDKKLSPYFSAGALWNFNTTSHLDTSDGKTVTFKSSSKKSRVAPIVGAGIVYDFAAHWSLIAQPTFSYTIPESGTNYKSYRAGFNAQIMYRF